MIPITFDEKNVVFAKNQPQYIPLPAYKDDAGLVITKWKASFLERIEFLITGTLWLRVLTFNQLLQPLLLETRYPFKKKNHDQRTTKGFRPEGMPLAKSEATQKGQSCEMPLKKVEV